MSRAFSLAQLTSAGWRRAGRRLALGLAASWALALGLTVTAPRLAWAQHDSHGHGAPDPHGHAAPDPHRGVPGMPTQPRSADPHGAKQVAGHGADTMGAHGEGGHHELQHINWVYGLLGEREGLSDADQSILFRKKGTPVPFLANVINFGLVVGLLVSKAGPMVRQGLIDRREDLRRDSEAAAKAKAEAQERYNAQKARLDHVEEEVARIKADYAEQGRHEMERIEREGRERHERMVRDARQLLQQEGRALQQRLLVQTVEAATREAEQRLTSQLTAADQDRLAREFLGQLGNLSMTTKRGAA